MPWQQMVVDVAGEYDPRTGLPYYREVVVTIPRQGGKTTLCLGVKVQRCLGWGEPQYVAMSAQTGIDAKKKLIDDEVPILARSPLWRTVKQARKAPGECGLIFENGSRIDVVATSESAGHGRTYHAAMIDEAMADEDDRREQAMLPAMITVRSAQLWVVSTAGTERSTYLRRKVDGGRLAAQADTGSGVAYFEWSAPAEADPDDPAVWWACHPALGLTIDESSIRHARETMEDGEFRRAFLNQWTASDERVIPAITWDMVNGPDVRPEGRLVFGVDVNPERSAASIVAVSPDGAVEVIEHRNTVGWVAGRVRELDERWNRPTWAFDGSKSAPVASLIPDFGVTDVDPVTDMAAACGAFYDAVAEQTVSVRRHPSLDAAVAGAQRRFVGDGWTWARRGTVDICPLVAATAALWAASRANEGGQLLW